MSIELVMPSNHLILCRPLLLLPSIFPSIRVFSRVSSSHQVAKVLEFQLQHQHFQWIFRIEFLYNWRLWSPCSPRGLSRVFSNITVQKYQFFSAQPSLECNSHIHAWLLEKLKLWLDRPLSAKWCFFNMLFRFVTAFFPRSKRLWISCLQSLSTVILEPKKIKSVIVSIASHLFAMKWWDQKTWCSFLNVEF